MGNPPPMSTQRLAGPWVDVRSYAPAQYPLDGSQPWHTYIQAAVDDIVNSTLASIPPGSVGTLYFPPGIYPIEVPIIIKKLYQPPDDEERYTFCSIRITGDAPPYGGNDFHGSVIKAMSKETPGIIIQAGRAVRIENLCILGQNDWITPIKPEDFHVSVLYDDDTFLVNGVTDDRAHAPYAGICIDPFSVLPDDTGRVSRNVLYPGLESEYRHSGGSSDISIERCQINGFVVGIAISPNGLTDKSPLNAENIVMDSCTIGATKSALAIGQTQTRGLSCRNLKVFGAKYAIDCTHYGRQSGCCPSIYTANIGMTKYIFSTFSFGSGAAFDGMYCEGTLSIGVLGGGGSSDGYSFNGCGFGLTYTPDRPSIGYHLVNMARASFTACQIALSAETRPEAAPLRIESAGLLSFRDCVLGITNYPQNSPPFWITGRPWQVSFSNTVAPYLPDGAIFSDILPVHYLSNVVNQPVLPGCLLHQLAEPAPEPSPRWVASGSRLIVLGTVADNNLTLHPATGTATFQPVAPGVVAPGDLVAITTAYTGVIESHPTVPVAPVLGRVTSIDPQTGLVTLSHVPDFVFTEPAPAANDLMTIVGLYKIHLPVTGDITEDGTTVTRISLPPTSGRVWIVGDRIRAKENVIPANTYVAAVKPGPAGNTITELTLSQPLTSVPPNGKLTLYDADVRTFQIESQIF